MIFSELLDCPYSDITGLIDKNYLSETLPNTPEPVIRQFYSDHWRKDDYQKLYKNIVIDKLKWKEIDVTPLELSNCEYNPDFNEWFNIALTRANSFNESGWSCIVLPNKYNMYLANYWEEKHTWIESPIFINWNIISCNVNLWLVEWHTRTWTLLWLFRNKIINDESKHKIWYGEY